MPWALPIFFADAFIQDASSSSSEGREGFRTTWNHGIEKESFKFKELEHVLIEKVEQLFPDMP